MSIDLLNPTQFSKKDGDEEAAVAALKDLRTAMFHGEGALQHLLDQNKPIHEDGILETAVAPVFPFDWRISSYIPIT